MVRFGVNLNTRVPLIYPEEYSLDRLLELGRRVDEVGFESIWVGDNFLAKPRLEAICMLSALAAITSRVRLGTSALISVLRNPVWLALSWATMDLLSHGRMVLCVCTGGGSKEAAGPKFMDEYKVASVPYEKRGKLLEEQLILIRRLWSYEEAAFDGQHYSLPSIRLEPRPSRPIPIWIANNPHIFSLKPELRNRMMARVGRLADGWLTAHANTSEYREGIRSIREFASREGREPSNIEAAYQVTFCIDDDQERAIAQGTEFINRYYSTNYDTISGTFWAKDPYGPSRRFLDWAEGMIEAGVETIILRFASPRQAEQVEIFRKEVLPCF